MSREAPVLILQYDSTQILPGGAGNAANNVAALGALARRSSGSRDATRPASVCSRASVISNTRGLFSPPGYCTPVKTRILAGGVHTAKQQIVRIDRVVSTDYDDEDAARAFTPSRTESGGRVRCDSPVGLRDRSRDAGARDSAQQDAAAARTRRRAVPILIDSRYNLLRIAA